MSHAKPIERPRGQMTGLQLTPSREKLLQGVADLEISLDADGTYRWLRGRKVNADGTYRWLGGRKVNAALELLEAEGWIYFATGFVPRITGLGRMALREARAARR